MSPSLLRPTADARPTCVSPLSALPLSIVVHILVLLALVVMPLLATDALPLPYHPLRSWMPVVAPPTVPPAVVTATRRAATPVVDESRVVPFSAPDGVRPETSLIPTPPPDSGLGQDEGVVQGPVASFTPAIETPPPPKPAPEPMRGSLVRPVRVAAPEPAYPEVARQARVEGVVIVEAAINAAGDVTDARVLRSQPLLDEAALAAVRQWRFTPALLNGKPVPFTLVVTVRFTLH